MLESSSSASILSAMEIEVIHLYPGLPATEWVEFDSMTNVRPSEGNKSRSVDSPLIRERILGIVAKRFED